MPDPLPIFRWLLFVFVTIYFCITTVQSIWAWYDYLRQRDRYVGMLRRYLLVQGLRIKLRPFMGDISVCLLLCVAFVLLWRCHYVLDRAHEMRRSIEPTTAVAPSTRHAEDERWRVPGWFRSVASDRSIDREQAHASRRTHPSGRSLPLTPGVFVHATHDSFARKEVRHARPDA